MNNTELMIVSIGLALDAFAASVCKGLPLKDKKYLIESGKRTASNRRGLICGAYFGGFQVLMPIIGFFIASHFGRVIEKYDHWIAFILLLIIGIGMIRESNKRLSYSDNVSIIQMIALAIATSIDALAVGVTFAALKVNLPIALVMIGLVTFSLSFLGVKIGAVIGARYKSTSQFLGGIILILLGLKILIEHLGEEMFG